MDRVWGTVALAVAAALAAPVPGAAQPVPDTVGQRALVEALAGRGENPVFRSTPDEREAARQVLTRALEELELEVERHEYRWRNVNGVVDLLLPPYRGVNVLARLPATEPGGQVVVLGAHYDGERGSPGAIDNASGVALVWAVARALSRLESRSRSFLFVFFDQEEDDEVGSRAFVRLLEREGVDLHSVHVADLAGWDPEGSGEVEIQSPPPELEDLYRRTAAGMGIPLDFTGGGSSDNASFLATGLPAVGVFQSRIHPQLHRPEDRYEVVDFAFLASMTALVTAALTELAR